MINRENSKKIFNDIDAIISGNEGDNQDAIDKIRKYLDDNNINNIELIKDECENTLPQIYFNDNCINYKAFNIIISSFEIIFENKKNILHQCYLNKNDSGNNIFDFAAEIGEVEGFKIINNILHKNQELIPLIFESTSNKNVFHNAAKKNKALSILFYYGILNGEQKKFINNVDSSKSTPLHIACYFGNYEAATTLIELGCDLNIQNGNNRTPLHLAAENKSLGIIKKLILYGAKRNIKDKDNRTPYDIGLNGCNTDIINVLKQRNIFQIIFTCTADFNSLKNSRKDILLICIMFVLISAQITLSVLCKFRNHCFEDMCFFDDCLIDGICIIGNILIETAIMIFVLGFAIYNKRKDSKFKEMTAMCGGSSVTYSFDSSSNPINSRRESSNLDNNSNQIFSNPKTDIIQYISAINQDKSMCIKCFIPQGRDTVHCVACDRCVENYDHHCVWLNTCICDDNKLAFWIFVIFIMVFLLSNIILTFVYEIRFGKNFELLFGGTPKWINGVALTFISFYCLILIVLFFTSLIPFFCFSKNKKKKISNNPENENKEFLLV